MAILASASTGLAASRCRPSIVLTERFPLHLCQESANQSGSGSVTPYASAGQWVSNYRVQYLYKTSALNKLRAAGVQNIKSMHARILPGFEDPSLQWSYTGAGNAIKVDRTTRQFLDPAVPAGTDFNNNRNLLTGSHLNYAGPANNGTINIGLISEVGLGYAGGNAAANLSDFYDNGPVGTRNNLTTPVNVPAAVAANESLLVDIELRNGVANNAYVWDSTESACSADVQHATQFDPTNPGVPAISEYDVLDSFGFVWVFKGDTLPAASTIQQQIAEIIRLLLTPEGLRCAGLDDSADGTLQENAVSFPYGKDLDPISPTVTNDGTITGEEAGEGSLRREGWLP